MPETAHQLMRSVLFDLCFKQHDRVHCCAVCGHDTGELPLATRNSFLELSELGYDCPFILAFGHRL